MATTTTMEPIKEHALEAFDMVMSMEDASILGGESDDVTSSAFIHGDDNEMVEHGIFPSTMATYVNLSDFSHHIESESDFTTSPIYDVLPQFPCEESHNPHHLSEMSDSTICDIECTYLEGVSEPPHRASEATMISNNLTSTSIVSSHLVLGPIYDGVPIRDDFVLPLDKTMAMVEYDAPPTWFHHVDDATSPTPHEWNENGNIGDGDALVPPVDILDIDCLHDVDQPITMLHASATSSCDDLLPIYNEYDDSHVESISCVMPC